MRKQLLVLLAGISLVSGTAFAGELTSFTHEAVVNDFDGGKEHIEWTLGKGSYKINDKLSFNFDIDKDFIKESNGTRYEGWDTEFGVVQSLNKVGNWDLSLNYLLRYDDKWNTETHVKSSSTNGLANYIVSPYLSKDITIAGKSFSFGTELWFQVGGNRGEKLKSKSGEEVNFYLSGPINKNVNLSLAMYNLNYYDGSDNYDYTMATEDKISLIFPLKENLSLTVDNYIYAEKNTDTEDVSIDAYVKPIVKYTKKVDEHLSLHAAAAYEVYNYNYSKGKDSAAKKSWNNNEMEVTLGFKIK